MATDTVVHAQLEVSECVAELYLNGVPVMRLAPPKMPIQNVAVDQLLVPGENSLEIVVEPGAHPSVARTDKREVDFRVMTVTGRLIRFPEGVPGFVENGELLAETRFSWTDRTLEKQYFPQSIQVKADLGAAHGRWGWQNAEPLVLDDALVAEARVVLEEVETALRAGNTQRFWELTELQIQDVLKAYPALTEDFLRADLATLMAHYQKIRDPVMTRDPAAQDFRLVADDRMLQCIDKDYTTSFKLRDPGDGTPVEYTIFLARIGKELRIVR